MLNQRIGVTLGQRLPFRWVMICNSCLGTVNRRSVITVNKTAILGYDKPTFLEPCDSFLYVKDNPVFKQTVIDECEGLSVEDQTFLDIMVSGFQMSASCKLTAPLPFRTCRPLLHNNREAAMKRAISFKEQSHT